MQNLLRVGQVFRCSRFSQLVYELDRDATPPVPNRKALHFDHSDRVTVHWTEKGEDGWERKHQDVVDLSVPDGAGLARAEFKVLETALAGGGTGHGPHDVYPDGHIVLAEGPDGARVRFYQTGCFVGLVAPSEVELVGGPEDRPGKWVKTALYEVADP